MGKGSGILFKMINHRSFFLRIHNPVFPDACLGIEGTFG